MNYYIQLSRNAVAWVDKDVFELLNKHKWTYDPTTGYAYRRLTVEGVYKKIYMHRLIMNNPKVLQIDHINGNGLDNRKQNLRICSRSDNQHNRGKNKNNKSGHKNIYWHTQTSKWRVGVMHKRKNYHGGEFDNLEDAVKARDRLQIQFHGSFARSES